MIIPPSFKSRTSIDATKRHLRSRQLQRSLVIHTGMLGSSRNIPERRQTSCPSRNQRLQRHQNTTVSPYKADSPEPYSSAILCILYCPHSRQEESRSGSRSSAEEIPARVTFPVTVGLSNATAVGKGRTRRVRENILAYVWQPQGVAKRSLGDGGCDRQIHTEMPS